MFGSCRNSINSFLAQNHHCTLHSFVVFIVTEDLRQWRHRKSWSWVDSISGTLYTVFSPLINHLTFIHYLLLTVLHDLFAPAISVFCLFLALISLLANVLSATARPVSGTAFRSKSDLRPPSLLLNANLKLFIFATSTSPSHTALGICPRLRFC